MGLNGVLALILSGNPEEKIQKLRNQQQQLHRKTSPNLLLMSNLPKTTQTSVRKSDAAIQADAKRKQQSGAQPSIASALHDFPVDWPYQKLVHTR